MLLTPKEYVPLYIGVPADLYAANKKLATQKVDANLIWDVMKHQSKRDKSVQGIGPSNIGVILHLRKFGTLTPIEVKSLDWDHESYMFKRETRGKNKGQVIFDGGELPTAIRPNEFILLLSYGIDLFNLIDEGKAIDLKTF